ncbi:MAG: XkdX family protein [Oscillibacter sp.]
MFNQLKRLYDGGRLDAAGIARAVAQGWITQEDADKITGKAAAPSTTKDGTGGV